MAKEPITDLVKPELPLAVAPEPPVVAPIVAPEPPLEPAFSLKDLAQTHGYDPGAFDSDQSLAETMFAELDQGHENKAFTDIGRQFAPYADKLNEFQAWQAEQAKPIEKPPEEKKPGFEWDSPEYDPRWEGMVERDERGYFKAPDGLPSLAPVAEKMNRYREFQTDALTKFLSNPQELIHAANAEQLAEMEARIIKANEDKLEEVAAKQRSDAEMNAYVQQQEKDLFEFSDDGKMQYDPQGSRRLTVKGKAMAEYADMLEKAGIEDPSTFRQMLDICMQRDDLSGRFKSSPPPTEPPPRAPVKKRKFLDRVRGNNRGGTIPDPTAPEGSQQQNPDATMEEISQRIAGERGVSL